MVTVNRIITIHVMSASFLNLKTYYKLIGYTLQKIITYQSCSSLVLCCGLINFICIIQTTLIDFCPGVWYFGFTWRRGQHSDRWQRSLDQIPDWASRCPINVVLWVSRGVKVCGVHFRRKCQEDLGQLWVGERLDRPRAGSGGGVSVPVRAGQKYLDPNGGYLC